MKSKNIADVWKLEGMQRICTLAKELLDRAKEEATA